MYNHHSRSNQTNNFSCFSIIHFNHLWLDDFRLSEKSKLHEKIQYPILMEKHFLPFFLYAVFMRLSYFSLSNFKREMKIRLCLIQFHRTDELNGGWIFVSTSSIYSGLNYLYDNIKNTRKMVYQTMLKQFLKWKFWILCELHLVCIIFAEE